MEWRLTFFKLYIHSYFSLSEYMIMSLNALRGEEWNQPYHIHNIIQVSGWWLCEHTIMSLPTTNVNITRVYLISHHPDINIITGYQNHKILSSLLAMSQLLMYVCVVWETPSTTTPKWKQFQIILSEKADKWYTLYTGRIILFS